MTDRTPHTAGFAIGVADVVQARRRISRLVRPSPLVPLESLSRRVGQPLFCKLETALPTGSFKLRGAANCLLAQRRKAVSDGVAAFSTGNHGRAVAWVGHRIGAPVTVFIGSLVPVNKREALLEAGAAIEVVDGGQDRAEAAAMEMAARTGALLVSAMNDPLVMAGQGTIGLELLDQLRDIGTIIVPLSGGGLMSGLLIAIKALRPSTRIIGVTMNRGAAMHASLAAGHPVAVEEYPSLADSLGGGIGGAESLTFPIVQALVDEVLLVDEAEIGRAIAFGLLRERVVLEGAAAAAIAVLLRPEATRLNGPIVALGTGASIDPDLLLSVAARHRADING